MTFPKSTPYPLRPASSYFTDVVDVDVVLVSADQILENRAFWNDLWRKSGISWATARAEQVNNWLETFANGRQFATLVVREAGRWIIALPLIDSAERRTRGIADLATNEWINFGAELMVDSVRCQPRHWDALLAKLHKTPWKVLWLDRVRVDEPRWQALASALKRRGWKVSLKASAEYGVTSTKGNWTQYEASRPERDTRKRRGKWLAARGKVEFTVHHPVAASDAQPLLEQAFAVEHRSWKGEAGTSILAAGIQDYYLKLGLDLARNGELEIGFLRVDGTPVAAMISCVSKKVCHNFKLGYDEAFKQGSPGQLMIHQHLAVAHANPMFDYVDDVGPVQPYTKVWNTGTYRVGQMVAVRPWSGGLFFLLKEKAKAKLAKLFRR